jgi:hypothetical protein
VLCHSSRRMTPMSSTPMSAQMSSITDYFRRSSWR